jgi:hypothetical protein
MIRLLAFLTFMSIAGCSSALNVVLPAGVPVHVLQFGNEAAERQLQPNTDDYKRLQAWLAANQYGWSRYDVTTPSGGVLLDAGDLRLQFVGCSALFIGRERVRIKHVNPSDYAFLIQAPASQ